MLPSYSIFKPQIMHVAAVPTAEKTGSVFDDMPVYKTHADLCATSDDKELLADFRQAFHVPPQEEDDKAAVNKDDVKEKSKPVRLVTDGKKRMSLDILLKTVEKVFGKDYLVTLPKLLADKSTAMDTIVRGLIQFRSLDPKRTLCEPMKEGEKGQMKKYEERVATELAGKKATALAADEKDLVGVDLFYRKVCGGGVESLRRVGARSVSHN